MTRRSTVEVYFVKISGRQKSLGRKIEEINPNENNTASVKMLKIDEEQVIDKQIISSSFC